MEKQGKRQEKVDVSNGRTKRKVAKMGLIAFVVLGIALFGTFMLGWVPVPSISNVFSSGDILLKQEHLKLQLEQDLLRKAREGIERKSELLLLKEQSLEEASHAYKMLIWKLKKKYTALQSREEEWKKQKKQKENDALVAKELGSKIMSMPPEKAVKILNLLEASMIKDILDGMDESAKQTGMMSMSPYLLSLMDPSKVKLVLEAKSGKRREENDVQAQHKVPFFNNEDKDFVDIKGNVSTEIKTEPVENLSPNGLAKQAVQQDGVSTEKKE